jgi:hypothetical protein
MTYTRINEGFWTDFEGNVWKVISPKMRPFKEKYKKRSIALRDYVFRRDGYKCQRCSTTDNLVLDHRASLRNGGTNHPDNLQTLCHSCNCSKAYHCDTIGKPWEMFNENFSRVGAP